VCAPPPLTLEFIFLHKLLSRPCNSRWVKLIVVQVVPDRWSSSRSLLGMWTNNRALWCLRDVWGAEESVRLVTGSGNSMLSKAWHATCGFPPSTIGRFYRARGAGWPTGKRTRLLSEQNRTETRNVSRGNSREGLWTLRSCAQRSTLMWPRSLSALITSDIRLVKWPW